MRGMDRARQALAQGLPDGRPSSFRAIADHSGVPRSTLHYRAHGLERGGVNAIGKQHFTCLYRTAREAAFTRRNIIAGWSKSGLFPHNPLRVLKDMAKPVIQPSEPAPRIDHETSAFRRCLLL